MADKLAQYKGTVLEDGYGVVGKKVMRDKRLGVIAKAIYCYLATFGNGSYPSRSLITDELDINKDTYTKQLAQLKNLGYVRVEQVRTSGGVFKHNVYFIEQVPCPISPDTVPPDTVPPDTVKPDTNSTSLNSTSLNSTSNNTPLTPQGVETGFEIFWAAYPKKTSKPAATKAWAKLKPNEETVRTMLAAIEAAKQTADWQKDGGKYVPYPATWLNNRRWEDARETKTDFWSVLDDENESGRSIGP